MCGEAMRLVTRERADRVAGTAETHRHQAREWVCPECDYFEEATENGADG
jgi:hypothetical protein